MSTSFLHALLSWLARAFAAARTRELPEHALATSRMELPRLPAFRARQRLSPPIRTIVPAWFASRVMCADNEQRGAGDIRVRIDQAVRNAVAVGFRRYHRLAA